MSISSNIVSLLNGESIVHTHEDYFIADDKNDLRWLELMEKMNIQATENERLAWAQDIQDVKNNVPSQIEMLLSSALTPSGRLFRSLFSFSDRKKMSQSVVLEEIPLVPYIKSNSGMKDHAENYVTYLRILHDYMPYVEVFNHIQSEMNPLYPRRRQAVLNGCLLYRKLLEAGAIQKGQKLSLEEGLSSEDVWVLIGRFADGREMTIDEQAEQMQKIVDKYLEKQEEKQVMTDKQASAAPVTRENGAVDLNGEEPPYRKPSFWQILKRDLRTMKRRRQYRRATTPSIWEMMGAAFSLPKRRTTRHSVPLSVRWPMLGALASMMRRPGPKKNFFQMMLDDLRPLTGYRHVRVRDYYEDNQVEDVADEDADSQQLSSFSEEEQEIMRNNPELAQLMIAKQARLDELKNRHVSFGYRIKDFFKAFVWMSDADKLDREFNKKYEELFRHQEAEAHPDKKTLWQKISAKLSRKSGDNESEDGFDQDGEVTLYEDSWWDKLKAKLATPIEWTRWFRRTPKTVESEMAVAEDKVAKRKALLARKEAILSKKGNTWRLEKKDRKERVLKTVPVVRTSKENGNKVTTLYYSRLNKIVRVVEQPTGMKVVTAVWLKQKRKATYWERTNENGLIERLAAAYGEATYGKDMITRSSPDGIQKKRDWLSTSELAHWQTAMNRVRYQEKTRKKLERIAERQKAKALAKEQKKVAHKKKAAAR